MPSVNLNNKVTNRHAFGRDVTIGSLYDARTESFIDSVFEPSNLPKIKTEQLNSPERFHLQYSFDDSPLELYSFLKVQPDQAANVLADVALCEGAGAVLKLNVMPNEFHAFLKYSGRLKKEELNLGDEELKKICAQNWDKIDKSNATHLVYGVVWGVDVIVNYRKPVTSMDSNQALVRSLSNTFDQFKEAMERDDATNFLDNELSEIEGLTSVVFSDVDITDFEDISATMNLKDSLSCIQKTHNEIVDGNEGRPILLLLVPLQNLVADKLSAQPFNSINKDCIKTLCNYEKEVKMFKDFFDLVSKYGSLVLPDSGLKQIKSFNNKLLEDHFKKKTHFKNWLVKRRNQGSVDEEFSFEPSKISSGMITKFIKKYSTEYDELKFHLELSVRGITYVKKEVKLRDAVQAYNEAVVLSFDKKFKEQNQKEFGNQLKSFFKIIDDQKNSVSASRRNHNLEDDLSSYVTFSNEFQRVFLIFEKEETSSNDFDSMFGDGTEIESQVVETGCVIEKYQNGQLIGPYFEGEPTSDDDTDFDLDSSDSASTIPFNGRRSSSSTASSNNPSSCKWNISFDEAATLAKPSNSAVLKIVCPGYLQGKCRASEEQKFLCEDCLEFLEYDFDDNFTCSCGRGSITSCSFKCNSVSHRGSHYTFERRECLKRLQSLKPRQEVNILVMGETGVGKSTFINAFANYLSFETMAEAENSDLISLIPSSFTVTDKYFEEKTVQFGQDENEVEETGASKTQSCRAYTFPSENRIVRIIDTPGIGDTRGVKQDAKNFENILGFISHYSSIHGILMLLKPNNSRLSIFFRFCIQELLCHLHKSASENIVFVFTNARSTFYRPGDTLPPLKKLLKEIKDKEPYVEIKTHLSTIYCLDNESFRFLVALKNQVVFDEDYRSNFSESWKRSVTECERLITHISKLRPHSVRETISLNEARRLIVALSKPLGDITQNIQLNISMVQDQKDKIKRAGDDIEQLKKNLYVPVVDLEPMEFPYPRTVCGAPTCYTLHTVDGIQKIDYTQVCHGHCYLSGIPKEVVNCQGLKDCWAMRGDNCHQCGCHYEKHLHIYYENKQVYKQKLDTSVQDEINNKEKRQDGVKKVISDLETRSFKLQQEQVVIMKTSAKFASFLKRNAIIPYSDALKDYLEYLISVEEQKSLQDAEKKALVAELTKMKESYEAEVKCLDESINFAAQDGSIEVLRSVTANDINDAVSQLFDLEINGDAIRKMVQLFEKGRASEHASYCEQVYQRPRRNQRSGRSGDGIIGKAFNALQKLWM